jgi:hypothetical protein
MEIKYDMEESDMRHLLFKEPLIILLRTKVDSTLDGENKQKKITVKPELSTTSKGDHLPITITISNSQLQLSQINDL